tara:strand:+ start:279 stop:857 length:579 start_codon:yes stop_codon:yes gene_type:complete
MNRETRFINNRKQDKVRLVNNHPSINNMREGEEVLYHSSNGFLMRYRKQNSRLWSSIMNTDGNMTVEKTLSSQDIVNKNTLKTKSITLNKLIIPQNTTQLLITDGIITVTDTFHSVRVQTGSSDDLETINGGVDGQILIIKPYDNNDIVLKNDVDNILCNGGSDVTLNTSRDIAMLIYQSDTWIQLFYSNTS